MTLQEQLDNLRATRDHVNAQIAELHNKIKAEDNSVKGRSSKTMIFPIVRDFNCTVGPNVIQFDDDCAIFGMNSQTHTKITHFQETTIYDILVAAGAFESKGQARKNWNGIKEIPSGYSEIGPIGKGKLFLFIWNPSE